MLEKILAALVVAILQYLMSRKDLRDSAKGEVYRAMYEQAKTAYEWEVRAAESPDGGATLRVQPGATGIQLQSGDATVDGSPNQLSLYH